MIMEFGDKKEYAWNSSSDHPQNIMDLMNIYIYIYICKGVHNAMWLEFFPFLSFSLQFINVVGCPKSLTVPQDREDW